MKELITQHWIALVIYLIGCILAYGRYFAWANNIDNTYKPKWYDYTGIIILSWIIFIGGCLAKSDEQKWFKWLPIVLMMFCMGCMSEIDNESYVYRIQQNETSCTYDLSKHLGFTYTVIDAPCGTFKIGDKPIRPITDTSKQ